MATLTMNVGGSAITVPCQRAGRAEPVLVGALSRSFAGVEHTSVRAQRAQVPVVLMPVSASAAASIEMLFANGAQIPCARDVFDNGGATVSCSARVASELEPGGTYFVVSLSLSQVS
jgi:phosphatidylserine decarboxylase